MLARIPLGRPLAVIVLDLLTVAVALVLAYALRFDGVPPPLYRAGCVLALPLFAACTLSAFALCGAYRMHLAFAGPAELFAVAKGTALAAVAFILVLFLLRLEGVPRSVVPMAAVLTFLLGGSFRLGPRLAREVLRRPVGGLRVLVLGAGNAGEMIVREMLRQPELGYAPIAFVDDAPQKQGSTIHGLPVLGGQRDLPVLVRRYRIEGIIIAAPSATGAQMRAIVQNCQATGVPFRTVPGLREIMDGRVRIESLRAVRIEDLLGRRPVAIDTRQVRAFLHGKRILVTGAAGSIGSELCRQIVHYGPAQLVLLDRNETGVFALERELVPQVAAGTLATALCDITDAGRLRQVVRAASPHVIFHAAAFKHVPLLERHAVEAAANNVLGTVYVAEAAERCGVETVVFISTDKAVAPVSVLGATKRAAELLIQERAWRSRTRFITVRFGNVLGSQGSVLGLFQEQLAQGGPLTLTAPGMKRFFMTIPEAVQLITQAATLGRGGEIFLLDMGEAVPIEEFARQLIRLSGLEPDQDIALEYTGPRPGERLEERLWTASERPEPTIHPQILVARPGVPDHEALQRGFAQLRRAIASGNDGQVIDALRALVPDFVPGEAADEPTAGGLDLAA